MKNLLATKGAGGAKGHRSTRKGLTRTSSAVNLSQTHLQADQSALCAVTRASAAHVQLTMLRRPCCPRPGLPLAEAPQLQIAPWLLTRLVTVQE